MPPLYISGGRPSLWTLLWEQDRVCAQSPCSVFCGQCVRVHAHQRMRMAGGPRSRDEGRPSGPYRRLPSAESATIRPARTGPRRPRGATARVAERKRIGRRVARPGHHGRPYPPPPWHPETSHRAISWITLKRAPIHGLSYSLAGFLRRTGPCFQKQGRAAEGIPRAPWVQPPRCGPARRMCEIRSARWAPADRCNVSLHL